MLAREHAVSHAMHARTLSSSPDCSLLIKLLHGALVHVPKFFPSKTWSFIVANPLAHLLPLGDRKNAGVCHIAALSIKIEEINRVDFWTPVALENFILNSSKITFEVSKKMLKRFLHDHMNAYTHVKVW